MRTAKGIIVFLLLQIPCVVFAAVESVGVEVDSLMQTVFNRIEHKDFSVGESLCKLYVKQYANLERWHLGLNFVPGMTRFDRKERRYLTELFYDVHFLDFAVPAVRRRADVTTHRHGSGEMERVMGFMMPEIFGDKLFEEGYLSPLHRENSRFYSYSFAEHADSALLNTGCYKVLFKTKIDNIKLLNNGWILLDDSCSVRELYLEGWDEQCTFGVLYKLGDYGLERNMVHTIELSLKYNFAWNKLDVSATGVYAYELLLPLVDSESRKTHYDLSGAINSPFPPSVISDYDEYVAANRKIPLTAADSALYIEKGVIKNETENGNSEKKRKSVVADWLWTFGDQMISSHSLDWEGGNLKMSPIIKPSYLSYSSSRGLSYKMSLRFNHRLKNKQEFSLRPMAGYNFKQRAFYWDVDGRFLFDPLHLGNIIVDVGSGNRTYSSVALERIKHAVYDSLDFSNLNLNYFKDLYSKVGVQREITNGFEFYFGVNYHKRKLIGAPDERLGQEGFHLKRRYVQFAPSVRLTWQPGMYYYIKDGVKVNVGSRMPRFTLDIEQGIRGVMNSTSVYTRAEFDVQYNYMVNESDALYLRGGAGGYFYTKDVYFADYAFFRHNNLPVDKSDELDGTFQLLDSEWYNAANKYMRFHVTYESPFLVLQRVLPRIRFFKYERIYLNTLFISHLMPYSELGYGVETPYVDTGIFVGFENHKFHAFGYKFTISLFKDR